MSEPGVVTVWLRIDTSEVIEALNRAARVARAAEHRARAMAHFHSVVEGCECQLPAHYEAWKMGDIDEWDPCPFHAAYAKTLARLLCVPYPHEKGT